MQGFRGQGFEVGILRSRCWGHVLGVTGLGSEFWGQDCGAGVWGSGFWGQGCGVRVLGSGFWGWGFGVRGVRVSGLTGRRLASDAVFSTSYTRKGVGGGDRIHPEMLARAADTGQQPRLTRGTVTSTSFWKCQEHGWRWLFGKMNTNLFCMFVMRASKVS